MASKTISNLTSAGALTGSEIVPVVDSGNTRRTTAQEIANLGSGSFSTLTEETGVVHVNDFYPATPPFDHNDPEPASRTPAGLGYASIAAYIAACPVTLRPYFDSFNYNPTPYGSSTMPSISDECDAIAWQAASNYIYDTRPPVTGGGNNSAGRIFAKGYYLINKPIIFNHESLEIEGVRSNHSASVKASTLFTYGTVDHPAPLFDLYQFDEFSAVGGGRTATGGVGIQLSIKGMTFRGNATGTFAGSNDQSLSNYVTGLRISWHRNVEIKHCRFFDGLYDGMIFTGPGLFVNIERNTFYGVDRDAISYPDSGPNYTTTVWIKYNEFGLVGRYSMQMNMSGAITPDIVVMENSFEHANNSYYTRHPEWFIHGVKASMCFIQCGGLIVENNFYEGINGPGAYDYTCHLVRSNPAVFRQDGSGGGTCMTGNVADGPEGDTSRTLAALTYMGQHMEQSTATNNVLLAAYNSIQAISKANPGEVTTFADHDLTTGDIVHFRLLQTMNGANEIGLGPYTITVTASNKFTFGVNTTNFETFVNNNPTGPGNKVVATDHWWLDITNERNYLIGHNQYQEEDSLIFISDIPQDPGRLYFADNQYPYSARQSEIRNGNITMYGVPVIPAVDREGQKLAPIHNQFSISGITAANPPVVTTTAAHGITNGEQVYITSVVGMTQVNNIVHTAASVTSTTFALSGVTGAGYTAYSSGGYAFAATAKIRTIDPENGNWSIHNCRAYQRDTAVYNTKTNSGNYINSVSGVSTWAAGAIKTHGLDFNYFYGDSTLVTPTTHNGYVYQCKKAGTTHASTEPTWLTAIATDFVIIGITANNPPQVTTSAPHGFSNGDTIFIEDVRGMTQVNNVIATVASTASTTFTLSGVTGAGYTAYTFGGLVYKVNNDNGIAWKCIRTIAPTGDVSIIQVEDGRKVKYASAAPTTGRWAVGDRVWNSAPSAGHFGWICTVAGLAGGATWVEMT